MSGENCMSKKPKSKPSKKSNSESDKANAKPNVRRVRVADIVVKGDFRELNDQTVTALA